jgi:hypothetical protein
MFILRFAASCVAASRLPTAESLPTGFPARYAEREVAYHFTEKDSALSLLTSVRVAWVVHVSCGEMLYEICVKYEIDPRLQSLVALISPVGD